MGGYKESLWKSCPNFEDYLSYYYDFELQGHLGALQKCPNNNNSNNNWESLHSFFVQYNTTLSV